MHTSEGNSPNSSRKYNKTRSFHVRVLHPWLGSNSYVKPFNSSTHATSNFPMTFDKPLSESSSLTIRSVRSTEIRTKEFETNATSSAPSYHPLGSCCVWRDERRPRQREGKRIELRKTRIPVFQLTRVLMGQIEKWRCHRSREGRDRWWLEIACVWLQMSTFQTRIR